RNPFRGICNPSTGGIQRAGAAVLVRAPNDSGRSGGPLPEYEGGTHLRTKLTLVFFACLIAVATAASTVKAAIRCDAARRTQKLADAPAASRAVLVGLQAAALARTMLGRPYEWGGLSPVTGFDCSGLVSFVYKRLGVTLPRTAAGQFGV